MIDFVKLSDFDFKIDSGIRDRFWFQTKINVYSWSCHKELKFKLIYVKIIIWFLFPGKLNFCRIIKQLDKLT